MHWILVVVVYPALLITAGWAAWRWLMPEGIKAAIAAGEYGNWQGALAWLTEMRPVVWLVNRLRRIAYRLGLAEDPLAADPDGYDTPPLAPPPEDRRPAPAAAPPDDDYGPDPPRPGNGSGTVPILGGPIAAPDDWALLIGRVSGFEPEDDADLIEFFRGEAAGAVGLGEAWGAVADTCLSSIGLDPVAVQGTVEMADVHTEVAHSIGYALHRFLLVYGELMEAVADGLVLPVNAREWITGQGLNGPGMGDPGGDGDGEDWEDGDG